MPLRKKTRKKKNEKDKKTSSKGEGGFNVVSFRKKKLKSR
jgi:hypothetical protein